MSDWHRDNPDLCGTDADPWMRHASHRRIVQGLDDVDLNRLHDAAAGEDPDEDRYTNTVEDAAAFERRRADEAGDYADDRPTLAELEAEDREER